MDKNTLLRSAEIMLKKQKFHTHWADENILEISQDKEELPFAFLIIEEDQYPGIILSLSLDFHQTYIVADLVINLLHIAPMALGEAFYRGKSGNLYWNENAQEHFMLEHDTELLKDLTPITGSLH